MGSILRGFKLAIADLCYEWAMTLCVVFSLAAMFAPLIILLGLQNGIITTLMDRMRGDPYNLQVRPERIVAQGLDEKWFEDLRKRPDVGWVTPTLRGMAMSVDVSRQEGSELFPADMEPSSPGDYLLTLNGIQAPSKGEVVLSSSLAAKLTVMEGDSVNLSIRRSDHVGRTNLKVLAIAPLSVSYDKDLMWVNFAMVSAVETYVSGGAVPELGWKGGDQELTPKYDGVLVYTLKEIPKTLLARLYRRTGFDSSDAYRSPDAFKGLQTDLKNLLIQRRPSMPDAVQNSPEKIKLQPLHVSLFQATNNTVSSEKFYQLISVLNENDIDCEIVPWVKNSSLTLSGNKVESVTLSCISRPFKPQKKKMSQDTNILVSEKTYKNLGESAKLIGPFDAGVLKVACSEDPMIDIPNDVVYVSPWFMGVLRVSEDESITLKDGKAYFKNKKQKFTGFRLYAKSLESLNSLVLYLRSQNIDVVANLDQVYRVQKISSYMNQLYSAIAGILGVAAFLAIAANLYANVQRRKSALAYLQLLGSSRLGLVWFPLFKSLGLVSCGLIGAFIAYYGFGLAVNNTLSSSLNKGESFIALSVQDIVTFVTAVLLTSALASLLASLSVFRIDPAEAMRQE